MDRRTFLSGVGTVGILGAITTGLTVRDFSASNARTNGLAQAAGAGNQTRAASTLARSGKALVADGVTLGYLAGSAGMFATPGVERLMRANATGLRWARWDAASTAQTSQSALRSLFKVSSLIDLSIGALQRADGAAIGAFKGLDIVAHFAIDDAPYFAPFSAWRYEAAGLSTPSKSSQALTFSARSPGRVALEVNYVLNASAIANGISTAGMLYLPIGADTASRPSMATGLYILAAPSAYTGVQPDFGAYVFSGNVHAPVVDPSGRALDFDYLTLAIRPVAL